MMSPGDSLPEHDAGRDMAADKLDRFVRAQDGVYDQALAELVAGDKRSHWMWFVFPQIVGLSTTPTGKFYSVYSLAEAQAYLAHPLLGPRLTECTEAMLGWAGRRDAETILGEVDSMKFASSMTLFEAAGGGAPFVSALEAFFDGERDEMTRDLLNPR